MELQQLSIEELIFMTWEGHRGETRLGKPQSRDHCLGCRKHYDFIIDHLWLRWDHEAFEPFGVFINELINTSKYDLMMNHTSTGTMSALKIYFDKRPFWLIKLF